MNNVMLIVWAVTSIFSCIAWIAANIATISVDEKFGNLAIQMEGAFIFSSLMFHFVLWGI